MSTLKKKKNQKIIDTFGGVQTPPFRAGEKNAALNVNPERTGKNSGQTSARRPENRRIDCNQCKTQSDCCQLGAWIDLEEAKKIISRGIRGDFFHLEKDDDFPSGYRLGTSYEDNLCSFLDSDGLCRIHKVDYKLKPSTCRDFPYEKKKISSFAGIVCTEFITKKKKHAV